jgi:hypothetical protein
VSGVEFQTLPWPHTQAYRHDRFTLNTNVDLTHTGRQAGRSVCTDKRQAKKREKEMVTTLNYNKIGNQERPHRIGRSK